MEIKLNTHGQLIEPELHDGYAESLAVNRDGKSVLLKCVSEDGKSVIFRFSGILAFEGNDFKEGNIINEITFFRGASIPATEIKHLLFNSFSKPTDVENLTEKLERSEMLFVHLTPSYGLELKVICKDVSVDAD